MGDFNNKKIYDKIKRGLDKIDDINQDLDKIRNIRDNPLNIFNTARIPGKFAEYLDSTLEGISQIEHNLILKRRLIKPEHRFIEMPSFSRLLKSYKIKLPKLEKKYREIFFNLEKTITRVGCPICGSSESSIHAQHCINCGNKLYIFQESRKIDRAKEQLKELLKYENSNYFLWLDLASIYYSKGSYSDAIKAYKQFLQKNPKEDIVRVYLGLCYLKLNKYENAISEFDSIYNSNYNTSISTSFLGLAHALNGDIKKGIKLCKEALELNPKDKFSLSNLSIVYNIGGEYDAAIQFAEKCIDLDLQNDVPWNELGYAYFCKGQDFEACEGIYNSLRRNLFNNPAWKNLGLLLETSEQYKYAIEAFYRAIASEPRDYEAWYHLSRCYYNQIEVNKAYEAIKICLKINPGFHDALDLNELIINLDEKMETNYKKWYSLAKKYYMAKNSKRAADILDKCLSINPNYEEGLNLRNKILS
jgi:tetratricopeptide (TPR) repeat protein